MNSGKFLFYMYIFLLSALKCTAQEISFNHLTTNDGLSNNSVMAIYQDEKGFMWFGTRNGINLYNGNRFITYKFSKNNSNSLIDNKVLHITGNGKDEIYIITAQGISAFNTAQNQFRTLLQGTTGTMHYHKQLYISQKHKIYRYENNRFVPFYELKDFSSINISALYIEDEYIWMGTEEHGLFRLNKKHELVHLLPQGNISNIFKDSTGKVWIGTWEQGVYLINGTSISNFKHSENDPASISSNFARNFCEDKEGNIWIGTFNGLNKFNASYKTFTRYQKQETDKSLTNSSIWSLLCDRQGTIWAGTYFGGVNYFNPKSQIYRHFQAAKAENNGLSASIVGCITEDSLHNVWIGTEGGGITKYNPQTNTFQWYKHSNNPNSLSHNNVKTIYYDHPNNILWIGTHMGGLNKLDLRSNKFTRYHTNSDKGSLPSNIIREIVPYKDNLLLATHKGVCLFNPQTEKTVLLFQDSPISGTVSVHVDYQGTVWISGNGEGVYAYRDDTQKTENYKHNHALEHSISSNHIGRIYEDSQKRLWFCTSESGVDLYKHETNDFENFDEQKNGLGSNCVYDVCELSPNKILFTTDIGFSILDYPSRKFTNYTKENGLPLSAINERSVFKASNGDIYIGGTDGMISFREEHINYVPQSYQIYPFSLSVNGQAVQANDDNGILQHSLADTPQITLKADQSMFSIEYAISNYIPSNRDDLEYFLEGFSKNWTRLYGQQHTITYTNLNPGKYTLMVRAGNNHLIPESHLDIKILPPFYRTVWAYLLYTLCIGIILYFIVRTYKNRIKLQESLRYEQKHAEDIEQLNQTKLRFFTNISHEFRTPLTLIIGQMEMLLQARTFAPSIYNRILGVYKNCLQMRELITELLDFRKQEQGYMTIKVSEHNLVDFVYESYLLFQEYAAQRQITFRFNKAQDVIPVWYDKKQLQKVMNNLISNAFKHTKEGGKITVSIRKGNKEVVIEVTDNGSGIAQKDLNKIFDRFYQTEQSTSSSYMGTGIGLALTKGIIELHHGSIEVYSEPGEGATFSVHLKTGKEHFTPEQICESGEDSPIEGNLLPDFAQNLLSEQAALNSDSYAEKKQDIKIVIVEDNESLREMLAGIFAPFYQVFTACDGEEGWEKVQSEHPHLILSDVVMPKMSGTDLCKLVKENLETCHIPVVLLTARTSIEHSMEGLRLGADDYITKPFNVNILLSRCNNLINNRIMLQEKFSKYPQETPQITATNPMDKEFIDKAMRIIDQHIDNMEFNVDMLAREIGIARSKLFTKLKDITGKTPYDFIVTIRLKRAAILLKEHPELNISEISDKLGFSSPRQFSKSFKEKYQVVPQAYRKGESDEKAI